MRRAALALVLVLLAAPALALPLPGTLPPPSVEDCARPAPLPPCNRWASKVPFGPANEVHIAADPTDPLHFLAVGKDYSLGANGDCRPSGQYHVGSASYVTFDGGVTWHGARVPAPYPNGGAEPSPLQFKCGSDPVAAVGADGTAYYILLNFQYTGGRKASIAVARSTDGGLSWPASDIRVLHTSPGDDKEWGAVDGAGRVHVVWVDSGRLLYARSSTDFVFEPARQLATGGGPEVAIGPNDEVYVTWTSGSNIMFTRSLDHGATFQANRVALAVHPYSNGGPPRLPFLPQLTVDRTAASPYAGRVYLTWPDTTGGDSNVYMSSSGDGGATWTAPKRVDDNALPMKRQVMPTVSVAPNGRVDIAWQDERLDPGGSASSILSDVTGTGGTFTTWTSSSTDAGATWSPNRLASDAPLATAWSFHQDGSVFIGDYMGIASTDAYAWPMFPGNSPMRLAEGMAPEDFDRADATTAPVDPSPLAPLGALPPPGVVPSVEVGDAHFGNWDGTFLD